MARAVKQQLKMATQAHLGHLLCEEQKPQGHTKHDEPMSHLPHSISQQPVTNGKIERKKGGNTDRLNLKVSTPFKLIATILPSL